MAPTWLNRQLFLTIRGKILLAFTVLGMMTGALGLYAVRNVVESGRLVVRTYDKPLMAINHARLAQADFNALELVIERRGRYLTEPEFGELNAGGRHGPDTRIDELSRAVSADLKVAEERSATRTSAVSARTAAREFELWCELRQQPVTLERQHALREQTARVLDALDVLGELTADDGFRDRERSLKQVERYRRLSIYATLEVLLVGFLIALTLARKMVTPIAAASHAAGRIASGELDTVIRPGGQDELGRLLASMTVMRDNIRRMMDREIAARRSAQAQLINAIESAESGVALIGADGRVLIANSRIRQLFPGRSGTFVTGESVPAEIDRALAETGGEIKLDDGRWLRLTHSPSREGGFVLIASDISALKEREDALLAARDAAEAANRAKTDFMTNMSHELRTPLSAVIGFSELIARESFGPVGQPRYKAFAEDILHAGRHLMDVISDILDIAKAQSGTVDLRLRTVRLEAVVRGALRIVHENARDAEVDLTTHLEHDLPQIEADTVRLRQVLLNLLSNAIKFTPRGGAISIHARRHQKGVALVVRDNGTGMAPEDIPRALQPFVQVDTSLARRHGGTGLGLPLTKIFVELHGGWLEIESELDVGTTVTVILPAVPGGTPATPWPANTWAADEVSGGQPSGHKRPALVLAAERLGRLDFGQPAAPGLAPTQTENLARGDEFEIHDNAPETSIVHEALIGRPAK